MKENRLNSETLLYAQVADQIPRKIRQSVYRAQKISCLHQSVSRLNVQSVCVPAVATYNFTGGSGRHLCKTKIPVVFRQTDLYKTGKTSCF